MTFAHFAFEHAAAGRAWTHLEVARFDGTEQISGLGRYELLLLARTADLEVDPAQLVGQRAALRLDTAAVPEQRVVHGVIVEAEEVEATPTGMVYRVMLTPPLVRASYRRRCRVFLDQTLRQILGAVLTGDPLLTEADGLTLSPPALDLSTYAPATERFTWRIQSPGRLDSATARPFCVQYNETDLDFLSRLIEDEGFSYHFENGTDVTEASTCLLVIADSDDGRPRLDPDLPLIQAAVQDSSARTIASMRLGARLRPASVTLDDYNWANPAVLPRATSASAAGTSPPGPGTLFDYRYPGGLSSVAAEGQPLSDAILERHGVEALYATGSGPCRLLTAGLVFQLEHAASRYDGEYLVTRLVARGAQPLLTGGAPASLVPYTVDFECARRGVGGAVQDSRFRPARVTPRPRIQG